MTAKSKTEGLRATLRVRFKERSMERVYRAMLVLADDRSSELYWHGEQQHRGAGHRCAFWDGYNGLKRSANVIPNTMSYAAFVAGKEHAKRIAKREKK